MQVFQYTYLDSILVTESITEDHLVNLYKVLSIIATAGLKLNKAKCEVLLPRVEYLGHMIDGNGLHPTKEKVRAIQEAPQPRNVSKLRSFLGIINAKQKHLRCKKGEANQKQQLSDYKSIHSYTCD